MSSFDSLNPQASSRYSLYFFTTFSNQCSSQRMNSSTRRWQSYSFSRGVQNGFSSSSFRVKIQRIAVSSRSSLLTRTCSDSSSHLDGSPTRSNHFLQFRNYSSTVICPCRFFSSIFSQFLSEGWRKSAVRGSSGWSKSSMCGWKCSSRLSLSLKWEVGYLCLLLQGEYLRQELLLFVLSPSGTRSNSPSFASPISFFESYLLSRFSYSLISSSIFRFCLPTGFAAGFSVEELSGKLSYLLSSFRSRSLFTFSLCRKRINSASWWEGYGASSNSDELLSALTLFSCLMRPLPASGANLYFLRMASALWPSALSVTLRSWKTWLCLMTSDSIISSPRAKKCSRAGWESLLLLSARSEYSVLTRALLSLATKELQGLTQSLSLLIMRWILQLRSSMFDAFNCSKCFSFSALRNYTLLQGLQILSVGSLVSKKEGGRLAFALPLHSSLRAPFYLGRLLFWSG